MNNLMNQNATTMTLKEITDLLEVEHNKAMHKVEKMAKDPEFGTVAKTDIVYNDKGQTIETYQLNKRQSIAAAARLNTALLMRIIDRWLELESAEAARSTAKAMDAENRAALRMEYRPMTDALKTTREDIGKETKSYHYSNEHEMPESNLRDLLTPIQKQAMLSLQKANTVYLEEILAVGHYRLAGGIPRL